MGDVPVRIFYRVRQFFRSWRVRLVPEDYGLLVEYLNEGEQALFSHGPRITPLSGHR